MQRKPLLWQLYPSFLLIILVSLVSVAWYSSQSLPELYIDQTAASLEEAAHLIDSLVHEAYEAGDFSRVDALCKELGHSGSNRITVILPSGRVVGDSEEDPAAMDNHADRPEIIEALAGTGEPGVETRFSKTLAQKMMYVAIPMRRADETVGILRTSVAVASIDKALLAIYVRIAVAGFLVAVAAAVLSLLVARKISRPLEEMRRGAELFAKGDFTHQLSESNSLEIGALAGAMNKMAGELDERIRTITRGRNEQQAVLSSMVESVIAVDADCRCISINQAGARLIGAAAEDVQGKNLNEIVSNTDLQQFVQRALQSDEPIEGQIVLDEVPEQRYLHAHGAALRDGMQKRIGAVVVMNDITRLRRLERVRRDFVANVSHELKTPITSIKGFVETLIDGAMDEPEDAKRFLEIIARQAGRLNAIINDLLALSKLEQQTETMEIALSREKIRSSIDAAAGLCEIKSTEKGIRIIVDCDEDLTAYINDHLLEHALVNLIDNAIKYSDSGSEVHIRAQQVVSEIQISVQDHGCGIEHKYLPRLFERFYRVDKARSRKLGGTGLGLAIVKHIAQVHRGRVSAQSSPGEGSTFTIHIPAGPDVQLS
ncbi:MAG: PAS domain-containing protein [Planctomycetes bacterium]|nr:PAS domain-containing protein [Planctomycetota bacterium]